MRTSRCLLAAPVTVVLLGALAACGGSSSGVSAGSSSPEAATVAEEPLVEEPQVEVVELTAENLVETIAAAQQEAATYDFALTSAGAGYAMQASGSARLLGSGETELAMVLTGPQTGDMEIRLVGGLVYLSLGEVTQGKFLQIDPNDPSDPFAAVAGNLADQADPTKGMAKSQAAIIGVTKSGDPQQMDGVLAQPYEVVIDTTMLPPEARAAFAEAEAAGLTLPATITYVYWMGPDNLIRMLSFDLLGTSSEMTFTNWGSGAPISVPSADQVTTEAPFGA